MIALLGTKTAPLQKLAYRLGEAGVKTVVTGWTDLGALAPDLCIALTPPADDTEVAVLRSLIRRGLPLFRTGRQIEYRRFGASAVLPLPVALQVDELKRFAGWFRREGPAASERTDGEAIRGRELVRDLRLASELQRSILPVGTPPGLPVTVGRRYVPYQYIGGDFYDFLPLEGGRLGLVIADACGHGVPAAFMTAMFKTAFGHLAQEEGSPAQTLARLNSEFVRTLVTDLYMTAFYLVLDPATGEMTYCSAGHPSQLLFRADGQTVDLTSQGFMLGSVDGIRYADARLEMAPGDRLLLFTDGLVETSDARGDPFGRERVQSIVRRRFDDDVETILNELLSEAVMYVEGPTFTDDVTVLLAELAPDL